MNDVSPHSCFVACCGASDTPDAVICIAKYNLRGRYVMWGCCSAALWSAGWMEITADVCAQFSGRELAVGDALSEKHFQESLASGL